MRPRRRAADGTTEMGRAGAVIYSRAALCGTVTLVSVAFLRFLDPGAFGGHSQVSEQCDTAR